MDKIQIGWKAKDEGRWFEGAYITGTWAFFIGKKPELKSHCGLSSFWYNKTTVIDLPNHPEQHKINWKDSLQPVYIEV